MQVHVHVHGAPAATVADTNMVTTADQPSAFNAGAAPTADNATPKAPAAPAAGVLDGGSAPTANAPAADLSAVATLYPDGMDGGSAPME